MDVALGQVRLAPERTGRFLQGLEVEEPRGISEQTAREIDEAIRRIVGRRTGYVMTSTATPYMDPPPPQFVRNYVAYLEAAAE